MTTPAAILREIHRLRRQAKDLQTEIERLPRQLKAQQTKIAQQEENLRQGQEALKRVKMKNHERESQLKEQQSHITKYEKQRNEAKTKKEYDALQAEISSERRKCQAIEDDILAGMLEIDDQSAKLPELEKAIQRARAEVAEFEKTATARQAEQTQLLAQVLAQIKQVEASLPDDLRPQYERLLSFRSEDAMSQVQERTCTACYTSITAQNYNELLQGQFVLCKSCGRILYLTD